MSHVELGNMGQTSLLDPDGGVFYPVVVSFALKNEKFTLP